jgi:hypothetical protein
MAYNDAGGKRFGMGSALTRLNHAVNRPEREE